MDQPRTTIDLPFSPEEVLDGTARERLQREKWDRWYGSLPADLRRKLSLHDFKRLGDCFKAAFGLD
jgi:hypothetical protein